MQNIKKVEIKKSHSTIDFAELYKDIKDTTLVQMNRPYEKHSQYYNSLVDAKEAEIEKEIKDEEKAENQKKLEEAIAASQKKGEKIPA